MKNLILTGTLGVSMKHIKKVSTPAKGGNKKVSTGKSNTQSVSAATRELKDVYGCTVEIM